MSGADEAFTTPEEIERRSFEIIAAELGRCDFPEDVRAVVMRVIHATADFDYAETLAFSPDAVRIGRAALRDGAAVVTDTRMARSGINKAACLALGCGVYCFVADEDVAIAAKAAGCTRSSVAMDKAVAELGDGVYVVGNAPTALIRLVELIESGEVRPKLVVGVPVGFVNVVESKEMLTASGVPYIVSRGRKGGSTVAAAIVNALLYLERPR